MTLLKVLLLPPGCFFLLAGLGLLLARRRLRLGRGLIVAAAAGLYVASMPLVAAGLVRSLEAYPAWTPARADPAAEAIVVLGADIERRAPEYGEPTLGELSLQRARYAARLHARTGLPVLVAGGRMDGVRAVGQMLRDFLEDELGVPVRWVEHRSANTWENAAGARELLAQDGVQRVYVVTHAWHMPRAMASFEAAGLEPVAAPTVFHTAPRADLTEVLPSAKALRETYLAAHEWVGRAFYALAYGSG